MKKKTSSHVNAAVKINVDELLERRKKTRALRASALKKHPAPITMKLQLTAVAEEQVTASFDTAGHLIAVGDSWFDYPIPFCDDILVQLHDRHAYNIESSAHFGDRVESMAYKGGQLDRFIRNLDKLHDQGITPKAVLVSGGGNDFAGDEFGMLLNTARSNIAGWNQEIVDGLIQQRLRSSYHDLLASIHQFCIYILGTAVPALIHGYDYPVPDGRGFLGGAGPLPGPWLKPGFDEKFFTDVVVNTTSMRTVIDQFNDMLADVAKMPDVGQVHYINLRGTLSSVLAGKAYQKDWNNELHPTERGFIAMAQKFADVLSGL